MSKRNKKKFAAQEMVMLLGVLAHKILVWTRGWLSPRVPHLVRCGMLVRDWLHISGFLRFDAKRRCVEVGLKRAAPQVAKLAKALGKLLKSEHIAINLCEI